MIRLSLYVHLNRIKEEDQALFNLYLKPLSVAVIGQMSSAFRPFKVGNLEQLMYMYIQCTFKM